MTNQSQALSHWLLPSIWDIRVLISNFLLFGISES